MTYQELLELKNKRAMKLQEGQGFLAKKDLEAHKALMGEVAKMNAEIDAAEAQLAEEGRFDDKDEKLKGIHMSYQKQQEEKAKGKAVDDIRRSNEYANAFAKALRSGVTVKRARGMEGFEPLMKALQETGGDPEGADGGFLVPQDFDNMIHEYEKEYLDLSQLFTVESVRSSSGWGGSTSTFTCCTRCTKPGTSRPRNWASWTGCGSKRPPDASEISAFPATTTPSVLRPSCGISPGISASCSTTIWTGTTAPKRSVVTGATSSPRNAACR